MFKDRVTVTWSPRFLDPRRPPWPQIGTLLVKAGTDLRQLTLSRIEYPTSSYNAEPVRCSLVGPPCSSKAGETPNSKPTSPSLLQSSVRIPHIKLQGGIFVRSHTFYYSICTNASRNWSAWGLVTFSRPRPAKLWIRTRGAWHGQYKNPIPSLLGWKSRPNRESIVSH